MTQPKDELRRRLIRSSMLMLPAATLGGALSSSAHAAETQSEGGRDALKSLQLENALYWGADPTGKKDSSSAFTKMARSQIVTTIHVPPGDYAIGRTVDLRGKNLTGSGRQRWKSDEHARFVPRPELKGAMFKNHGPVVRDLNFSALDQKDVVFINSSGYNTVIENVSFSNGKIAIEVDEIMVNYNLVRCAFVGTHYGVMVHDINNGQSTTARFIGNEFNYCENAIIFEGALNGATFQDNIFENIKGDAILAKLIYDSNFIGNWWERRNGGDKNWPCVRTTMKQQIMNCFASANKCVFGWRDMFSSETHSGHMGGVSVTSSDVVARRSTGNAVRMTPSMLRAESDDWAGNVPFVIQGSQAKARNHVNPIVFRHSGANGNIEFDSDAEITKDGVWKGKLRFASKTDSDDKLLYDEYQINRARPGIVGKVPVKIKETKDVREALTGVPQFVKWRKEDKDATGSAFFSHNEIREEGQVELSFTKGEFEFREPIVTVTVDDSGIYLDGISYLPAYSGAQKYKAYKGFVFHFKARGSDQPKTPDAFNIQIFHPY
ncbi:right-handed parallel beta-helix repeat-containing protein [Phytohalomonas tamaricis]|uniref:hypothetical protein n=1 Tax=Phytohalomonas tamaricis TaxID=2081032 RepID=UPI000D0B53C6|nr:hypothetical protein [Phytohalomonas tamaricis]